jgi:hypothetical protein
MMTTQNIKAQRGGKRLNAGRPTLPDNLKKRTAVIRVDIELLPAIEELKNNTLISVTENQMVKTELERFKQRNQELVMKYDAEHLQVVSLTSKLEMVKREPTQLRYEIKELERKLNKQKHRQCQCLTASGSQCERKAMNECKLNGFVIYLCEQHYQKQFE